MSERRRRRWFRPRYSLATLFVVVTVLGCWLGWEVHIVRRRRVALDWIRTNGGFAEEWRRPAASLPPDDAEKRRQFSELRRWLGDEPIYYINLARMSTADVTWEQREDLSALFPETWVTPEDPEQFPIPAIQRH